MRSWSLPLLVMLAAIPLGGCGLLGASTEIRRLAVVDGEFADEAVTDEAGRSRLLSALSAGAEAEAAAVRAVSLTDEYLVVIGFDACVRTNPRLVSVAGDEFRAEFDETGVNCELPIPAGAIFAVTHEPTGPRRS